MPDQNELPILPEVDDADRVVGLISRLPKDSVVRRIGMQVLQGRPIETIRPLVSALSQPSFRWWRQRQVSAWALGRAPIDPENRDEVANELAEVVDRAHREGLGSKLLRGFAFASVFALSFFLVEAYLDSLRPYSYRYLYNELIIPVAFAHFAGGVLAIPFAFWQEKKANARIRASAAESLGRLGSVEVLGTLAASLRDRDRDVRTSATQALHSILPQVGSEHYGTFGPATVEGLGRALSNPDTQLVLKVLGAIERAGTSAFIPWVERVKDRGRTNRVRDAAGTVLLILQERRLLESDRDRLLRPSAGTDPEFLLRAPAQAPAEDTALLLQPTERAS